MLDADDMLSETPETSLAKLPDEKSGAPQLERSAEVAAAQTCTTKSAVRNLRCHPFITCSLSYFEERKDN